MDDLKIIHTSNKNVWEIDLEDTLTYTTVIYNISDETLHNLEIELSKPKESYYIENTCKLNGKAHEFNSNKIYIKNIHPRENIILNIDMKVNSNIDLDEIVSFAKVNYIKRTNCQSTSYCEGSYNDPNAYFEETEQCDSQLTAISQSSITTIISRNVYINHDTSKTHIRVGEYVDFKFIVKNKGSVIIDKAILENVSNADIEIEQQSIYINGIPYRETLFENEIYIGSINPKETLLIAFRGTIKKVKSLDSISNKGKLNFFYKNDAYNQLSRVSESNEIILDLCPSITKSINLSKLMNIPLENPKIYQILDIFNYDIKVTSQNIVEKNPSQNKTLFLDGYITGRITYSADFGVGSYYENKIYIIEYEIPFKGDLFIPPNFKEFISVIPKVQFIDANLVEGEKIYINAILDIDLIED